MKAPLSWLKEFVPVEMDMTAFTHTMIMHGLGVESVERVYEKQDGIVVGKLVSIQPHQNSDHLRVCKADIGAKTLQIVTGAPNVVEGMVCPVATVGSMLPNGTVMQDAMLRGVASFGMLCSGEELGLTEEDIKGASVHGILPLPQEMEHHLGVPVFSALGLDDTVIDFEIAANRGDCMSILGLAREIGAALNAPVKDLKISLQETQDKTEEYVQVTVEEPALCPRYSARVMTDLVRGPSPRWMQRRLLAAGMRPVSNIVDITNYVMLEMGQPLHAFDYDAVQNGHIVVRRAKQNEEITTLDGKNHVLTEENLLIADKTKPLALAGVMGGANSEITEQTTRVLLESAKFDGANNRHTARQLGMSSEASSRYTKGVSTQLAGLASDRAAQLFSELGVGKVLSGRVDTQKFMPEKRQVSARIDRINQVLGMQLSAQTMMDCLEREGIEPQQVYQLIRCSIPYHRDDLAIEEDIIEEIARIVGYEKVPVKPLLMENKGGLTKRQKQKEALRSLLAHMGLHESTTFAFMSQKDFDALGYEANDPLRDCVKIINPLSEEYGCMRTTVVPFMVKSMALNVRNQVGHMGLFEISNVHTPQLDDDQLPTQKAVCCIGLIGHDFAFAKGLLEKVFAAFDATFTCIPGGGSQFHPTRKAVLHLKETTVGVLAEMHPDVMKTLDVEQPVLVAEFELEALLASEKRKAYQPLPKYPAMLRDLALVVDQKTPIGPMMQALRQAGGPNLEKVELFDVYQGDQAGEGKKSVAFALTLRREDRTMTEEEANDMLSALIAQMDKQFAAKLRGM